LLSSGIFGYTGVFAECHPIPEESYSDKDCQIDLKDMSDLMTTLSNINRKI
jgi:3-deoxy-D-manno-octulosonic acid (KDO) 8-phosphate synthase